MSPHLDGVQPRAMSFPRVSGDEPAYMIDTNTNAEFSPRERG